MGASKIRTLHAVTETTFGTDPTTGYVRVPQRDLTTPDTLVELIERPVQTGTFGAVARVAGAQGGSFSFKSDIFGLKTASTAAVDAAEQDFMAPLMLACGWTRTGGKAGTIGVGSSTTSVVLTGGHGARFAVGDIVGWVSGGVVAAAQVTVKATDTLTVSPALHGSPSESDVLLHAVTWKPPTTGTAIGDAATASMYLAGDGWGLVLSGCAGTVKLSDVTANTLPQLEWSFTFDRYNVTTYSLATAIPTDAPVLAKGSGRCVYGAAATAISSLGFNPGFAVAPQLAICGTNGRIAHQITDVKATGSAKPYFAAGFVTDSAAGTESALFAQLGGASKGVFALRVAKAQNTKAGHAMDVGGLDGFDFSFAANASGSATIPDFTLGVL